MMKDSPPSYEASGEPHGRCPTTAAPNTAASSVRTVLVDANSTVAWQQNNEQSKKTLFEAYILWLPPVGLLGFHHVYLRRPGWFIAYFFTLGFFGMGWLIDSCRMSSLVKKANSSDRNSEKRNLSDAYVMWLPPFGLIGFHHFYLRRPLWGTLYLFTMGLCGLGWLLDMCFLPRHTAACNKQIAKEESGEIPQKKYSYGVTYFLALFPLTGVLGLHHLYLGNTTVFISYVFTLGNGGIGWLIDWCRIPLLVERANQRLENPNLGNVAHLDIAYVLWFPPSGLLGFHHLYMRRYVWFCLYFCTAGLFGIGWLVDLFLLPYIVKTQNAATLHLDEQAPITSTGQVNNVIVVSRMSGNPNYAHNTYQPAITPTYQGYGVPAGVHYPQVNMPSAPTYGATTPTYGATAPTYGAVDVAVAADTQNYPPPQGTVTPPPYEQ